MKKLVGLLLTITAPLWIIPVVVIVGIWEGSEEMYEIMFGKAQENDN